MAEKTPQIFIDVENIPNGCLLRVKGELGLPPTTDHLETEFNRFKTESTKLVVLDLSGLSYISSLGVGMLVGAQRAASRRSGYFRLAAIDPSVLGVIRRAKVDILFDIFPTVQEALAAPVK